MSLISAPPMNSCSILSMSHFLRLPRPKVSLFNSGVLFILYYSQNQFALSIISLHNTNQTNQPNEKHNHIWWQQDVCILHRKRGTIWLHCHINLQNNRISSASCWKHPRHGRSRLLMSVWARRRLARLPMQINLLLRLKYECNRKNTTQLPSTGGIHSPMEVRCESIA